MKTKARIQPKRIIRQAIESLRAVDAEIEKIRDHFDMEWGEGSHSDLDVALSGPLQNLADARNKLDDILLKFRGKALRPNFPRKKVVPLDQRVKVSDLPLVF